MSRPKSSARVLRFIWGLIPWLVVILLVLFVGRMLLNIKEEKARLEEARKAAMNKEVPAVRVITLTLEPRRLEDRINLPAEVEPFENLWVKAEMPGQITSVLVKEGQPVKKGEILAKCDDRDHRTRLARIEANLKLARVEHERISTLVKEKIASLSKLDESEARLNDLIAQRREAQLALNRCDIKAPISGRLNEVEAKEGDVLSIGDPVAQILQFGKVKVTVGVPESDVAAVFDLKEADVVIKALNRTVKGKKVFLSRKPRTLARLYDLELMVPNPDGHVLPGMFAEVKLVKEVFYDALAVPLYAIITQGDERFVYVEKDGKAEKRAVELGVLVGWQVQVKAGLEPGERVIVVGHRFLDNGQPVEIMKNVNDPSEILKT